MALEAARSAAVTGEVPVGAVMVDTQTDCVIAVAGNRVEADSDPTAHAEMVVIRGLPPSLHEPLGHYPLRLGFQLQR